MSAGDDRTNGADEASSAANNGQAFVDALAPGTIIHQSYRISDLAGEGGAGAVYVAEHINLGHLVAIKTLFGKFVRDDDMRRRFLEEAIIQANLGHPNIVSVSDVLDDPPLCAIFMEYIDGSSLDKHLSALEAPDSVAHSSRLFVSILDAMTYAHSQGVVHRDIKPANILLAKSGAGVIPKVTDFGIAKVLSDAQHTETGTAMGTVYYASPEQLTDAKSVDHRADVYSLGCTLYEMLTLKLPFVDSTMFGVMKKHVQAPRPDPARINPLIPREISAAVMRAMAVDAKHRFQSCAEFSAEIRKALNLPDAPSASASGVSVELSAQIPATASGAAARPFSVSSADNPVLVRTPHAGKASGGPGPQRTQVNAGQTTPTSMSRSRSALTHDSSTSVFIKPHRETNAVGKTLWVVIGVLALGLTIALFVALKGEPEKPPGPGNLIGGDTDTAEPIAAEPDANDPQGSGEPQVQVEQLSLPQCNALSDRYAAFDANRDELGIATSALEDSIEWCTSLLEASTGGNQFDVTVGFLTARQMRALLSRLQGLQALEEGTETCGHASAAGSEIHLGLRRINTSSRDLPPIEARSLSHRRDVLSGIYVDVLTDFSNCTLATVPEALLSEAAVTAIQAARASREAEEAERERAAAEANAVEEGSGAAEEEAAP